MLITNYDTLNLTQSNSILRQPLVGRHSMSPDRDQTLRSLLVRTLDEIVMQSNDDTKHYYASNHKDITLTKDTGVVTLGRKSGQEILKKSSHKSQMNDLRTLFQDISAHVVRTPKGVIMLPTTLSDNTATQLVIITEPHKGFGDHLVPASIAINNIHIELNHAQAQTLTNNLPAILDTGHRISHSCKDPLQAVANFFKLAQESQSTITVVPNNESVTLIAANTATYSKILKPTHKYTTTSKVWEEYQNQNKDLTIVH